MKFSTKISFIILLLAAFTNAGAYDISKKFGIGLGGGYPIPVWGNPFNDAADPKWQGSVYGRYFFDSSIGMEIGASMAEFKDTEWEFKNAQILALWRMAGSASLTPVIGVGTGVTDIDNYNPGSLKLSLLGRVGAEYDLGRSFSLGIIADYQYVSKLMGEMSTRPAHVVIPQLTLTWYFGENKMLPETSPVPAPASTEEKAAMSDAVQTQSSATDKKPALTVFFDIEKADLKNEYNSKLKKIAERIKNNNRIATIIEGHADSTGPREFNEQLSRRRALAVKKQLMEYGVEESSLQTEGFGEDKPVASNKTKEGRAKNRRSALYISIKEKSDVM